MKELLAIQNELKVPKKQYNNFGKYNYRSCEDITEAVKPLLKKYNCILLMSDEIANIGERYYIKSIATIQNAENAIVSVNGYAREEETKKGMDGAQISGASSSYARKYALNGLFAIDDTKDPDTPGKDDVAEVFKIILKEYGDVQELNKNKVSLRDEYVKKGLNKAEATEMITQRLEALNGNS